MGRRLLAAIGLALLAAAAWWAVSSNTGADGLVVHVELQDEAGRPITTAQIERVFEERRVGVDESGKVSLPNVVLRERDKPSAAAIARAVRIHAAYHAPRAESAPTITEQGDGSWLLKATLRAHGVLRLYVDQTHLGACKAFPETDEAGRWEPMGGTQVARHGSPASYRVFAGLDELVVRIEGVPDKEGVVGVATRKLFVKAPALGHVVEKVLKPEQVQPILGSIDIGEGPKPPSLGGAVRIVQLEKDGRRLPLALVALRDDGTFIARRTAKGSYELEAALDFFPRTGKVLANGGESATIRIPDHAVWAELEHAGWMTGTDRARAFVRGEDGKDTEAHGQFGLGTSHIALPGTGTWQITINVPGTHKEPPGVGIATVTASAAGAVQAKMEVTAAPHGTVVVGVSKKALGKARGATVWIGTRKKTIIPGLADRATFPHLEPGRVDVVIEWDDGAPATTKRSVDIVAKQTTDLDIGER